MERQTGKVNAAVRMRPFPITSRANNVQHVKKTRCLGNRTYKNYFKVFGMSFHARTRVQKCYTTFAVFVKRPVCAYICFFRLFYTTESVLPGFPMFGIMALAI